MWVAIQCSMFSWAALYFSVIQLLVKFVEGRHFILKSLKILKIVFVFVFVMYLSVTRLLVKFAEGPFYIQLIEAPWKFQVAQPADMPYLVIQFPCFSALFIIVYEHKYKYKYNHITLLIIFHEHKYKYNQSTSQPHLLTVYHWYGTNTNWNILNLNILILNISIRNILMTYSLDSVTPLQHCAEIYPIFTVHRDKMHFIWGPVTFIVVQSSCMQEVPCWSF